MFSIDDMKSCIQEWFADASDPIEIAKTYHEIVMEAEKQLEFMTDRRDADET